MKEYRAVLYKKVDKEKYEYNIGAQTAAAKMIYKFEAGYRRKTKLHWMADDKIPVSEAIPHLLYDEDDVFMEKERKMSRGMEQLLCSK